MQKKNNISSSSESTWSRLAFWKRLNTLLARILPSEKDRYDTPKNRGRIISWCIFFSVLLWFFSSMAETYTRAFYFPTSLENLPSDEALRVLPPPEVRVEVQGEGLHLLQLYYNRPVIPISVEGDVFDLEDAVNTHLPADIRLQSVWPRYVQLEKEKRVVHKIPISLRADVELSPTYALLEPLAITPDSVVVTGPESRIESLTNWPTVPVRIHEVRDSLLERVALADSLQGIVKLGVRSVMLRARVAEFTEGTRSVEVFVSGVPSMNKAIQLDPPFVTVRFKVPLSQYNRAVKAPDFIATITYDAVREDTTGYVAPKLDLPRDVVFRDVEVSPARVRYYDLLVDR